MNGRTFIKTVYSEKYNIEGKLYLLFDKHYFIEFQLDSKKYGRKLEYTEISVPEELKEIYLDDLGWMSLEDLYEDILLGVVE